MAQHLTLCAITVGLCNAASRRHFLIRMWLKRLSNAAPTPDTRQTHTKTHSIVHFRGLMSITRRAGPSLSRNTLICIAARGGRRNRRAGKSPSRNGSANRSTSPGPRHARSKRSARRTTRRPRHTNRPVTARAGPNGQKGSSTPSRASLATSRGRSSRGRAPHTSRALSPRSRPPIRSRLRFKGWARTKRRPRRRPPSRTSRPPRPRPARPSPRA